MLNLGWITSAAGIWQSPWADLIPGRSGHDHAFYRYRLLP